MWWSRRRQDFVTLMRNVKTWLLVLVNMSWDVLFPWCCLSRKITRSWKIVYSLKQTRCDCQDGGYLSLCGMFKVLEALWHSKSMHPCIPRWCKHCGMYKGGKHCGVAGPCRCRGCHCRLCGISMVRACTIHGSDLEPSRNSSFVNKLSWFWKHKHTNGTSIEENCIQRQESRDLSWSLVISRCHVPVSVRLWLVWARVCVCACVWLVWVWEAGRTEGRNRKDAWKWASVICSLQSSASLVQRLKA